MKFIILLITFFCTTGLMADEVKIEINPPKPVMGEAFQAFFRVFTESSDEPVINFSPSGLEVAGKNNHGTSIKTIYSNGTLTTTREVTIVYDLIASRAGTSFLRDITVEVGGKSFRHPAVTINVLKEAEEMQDIFLMADVPKKSVFLGEGLIIRYYLYTRVQTNSPEVKRFPKLNNFLKRFLQEPERSERVSVDGQVYVRYQIYAAKLFPEKVGTLKIDPLFLSVGYVASRSNDPFGGFGFNRDFRNKSLSSESINIEVKPLPENGKPQNFTGLVGKHEFQVEMGQSRLIVNEPLELKLTVTGVGALENLEAPELIKHPGLEEFESNGDLKIMDADQATKVFDYTFLAKENLKLPGQSVSLNYFDPDSEKYVSTSLNISEIVVAGGNERPSKAPESEDKKPETPNLQTSIKKIQDYAAPLSIDTQGWRNWIPVINLTLGILSLIIAVGWVVKNKKLPQFHSASIPATFRKGEFDRKEFTKWLTPLIQSSAKSPGHILQDAELSVEAKQYFVDLLEANDYKDYSTKKTEQKYVYQARHFKELSAYIEKVKNEDTEYAARYS